MGWWVWRSRGDRLGRLMAAGLLVSGVGDVLLDLPGGFIAGVGTFALAHLLYIAAFLTEPAGREPALARQLPFVAWVGGLLAWAVPRVGELGVPFAVYGLIICAMMGRAAARESRPVRGDQRLVLMGAVLFGLSDSAIAIDRAGLVLPGREYWGILMYWAGQGLMALGAVRGVSAWAEDAGAA